MEGIIVCFNYGLILVSSFLLFYFQLVVGQISVSSPVLYDSLPAVSIPYDHILLSISKGSDH